MLSDATAVRWSGSSLLVAVGCTHCSRRLENTELLGMCIAIFSNARIRSQYNFVLLRRSVVACRDMRASARDHAKMS
jgi:hypothetical protein